MCYFSLYFDFQKYGCEHWFALACKIYQHYQRWFGVKDIYISLSHSSVIFLSPFSFLFFCLILITSLSDWKRLLIIYLPTCLSTCLIFFFHLNHLSNLLLAVPESCLVFLTFPLVFLKTTRAWKLHTLKWFWEAKKKKKHWCYESPFLAILSWYLLLNIATGRGYGNVL